MEGRLERGPALSANRIHAWRRAGAAVALVCVLALVLAPRARAVVTIGQLPASPPPATCAPNFDYLQPSITGGNFYTARQAGTIVSWSTRSSVSGVAFAFKVFRRTTDPDVFQVIASSPSRNLSTGLNTFGVNVRVRSGDMIGLYEAGFSNSAWHSGNLSDGSTANFGAVNGVRLNLSAVLVPDNGFTLGGITHDRKVGTATVTVTTTNPGIVALVGKGLKKRIPKTLAVAGPVAFQLASAGKTRRRLQRKGRVAVPVTVTFFPTGGDPSTQTINLKLKKKIRPAPLV
jgi:hypothetical protein